MAKLEHPNQSVSFSLPDELTTRQMLAFDEIIERGIGKTDGMGMYERLWPAVVRFAQDWQSELLELREGVLDEVLTRQAISALKWACLMTFEHFTEVRSLPKN